MISTGQERKAGTLVMLVDWCLPTRLCPDVSGVPECKGPWEGAEPHSLWRLWLLYCQVLWGRRKGTGLGVPLAGHCPGRSLGCPSWTISNSHEPSKHFKITCSQCPGHRQCRSGTQNIVFVLGKGCTSKNMTQKCKVKGTNGLNKKILKPGWGGLYQWVKHCSVLV